MFTRWRLKCALFSFCLAFGCVLHPLQHGQKIVPKCAKFGKIRPRRNWYAWALLARDHYEGVAPTTLVLLVCAGVAVLSWYSPTAPGVLGAIAVATKHELVLAIVGGLFVVEALSVIVQVLYFKRTGRRVFLMAPIHHHYEKKGWAEPTIVIRFWIISLILAMIGLATLKVR